MLLAGLLGGGASWSSANPPHPASNRTLIGPIPISAPSLPIDVVIDPFGWLDYTLTPQKISEVEGTDWELRQNGMVYAAYYANDVVESSAATNEALRSVALAMDLNGSETVFSILRPGYQTYLIEAGKQAIDWGTTYFMLDNAVPYLGAATFDTNTLAGFRIYLASHYTGPELLAMDVSDVATFDYRTYLVGQGYTDSGSIMNNPPAGALYAAWNDFIRSIERSFFVDWSSALKTYASNEYGRDVYISANRYKEERQWDSLDVFDYALGETFLDTLNYPYHPLDFAYMTARCFGKRFWSWNMPANTMSLNGQPDPYSPAHVTELSKIFLAEIYAYGGLSQVEMDETNLSVQNTLHEYNRFAEQRGDLVDLPGDGQFGVLYSEAGEIIDGGSMGPSFRGATMMMEDIHWPYSVLFAATTTRRDGAEMLTAEQLARCDAVILANTRYLAERQVELLSNYVNNGGTLIGFAGIGDRTETNTEAWAERSFDDWFGGDGVTSHGAGRVISFSDNWAGVYYQAATNEPVLHEIRTNFLARVGSNLSSEIVLTNAAASSDFESEMPFVHLNRLATPDGSKAIHLVNRHILMTENVNNEIIYPASNIAVAVTAPTNVAAGACVVTFAAPGAEDQILAFVTNGSEQLVFALPTFEVWAVVKVGTSADAPVSWSLPPWSRTVFDGAIGQERPDIEDGDGHLLHPDYYWKGGNHGGVPFDILYEAASSGNIGRVELMCRFSADGLAWSDWNGCLTDQWAAAEVEGTFTFDAPQGNGYYQFYTHAVDASGRAESNQPWAETGYGVDSTRPLPPTNVWTSTGLLSGRWTNTLSGVTFAWEGITDNLSGYAGMHISVADEIGTSVIDDNVSWTNNSWSMDAGALTPGSKYAVRMQLQDFAGCWSYTYLVFDLFYGSSPVADVQNPSATPGNGSLTVNWTNPDDPSFSYVAVYCREATNTYGTMDEPSAGWVHRGNTPDTNQDWMVLGGLENGTAYQVKLIVNNAGNETLLPGAYTPQALATPNMSLLGTNGAAIADDEAASAVKGTDFGSVTVWMAQTNVFSITNSSTVDLQISDVAIGGDGFAHFSVFEVPGIISGGSASNFTLVFDAELPFDVYDASVSFTNDSATSPYRLNLQGRTFSPYEPDDVPAQAVTIVPGVLQTGRTLYVSADADYVKFDASARHLYRIAVPSTDISLILSLLDTDGTTVLRSENSMFDDLTFDYLLDNAGTYYVAVEGLGMDLNGTYELSVVDLGLFVGDAYEPDNSLDAASNITMGVSQSNRSIHWEGDRDYIAFSATAYAQYEAIANNVEETLDVGLTVLDSMTNEIAQSDSGGPGESESVLFTTYSAGLMYILVDNYDLETGRYDVVVNKIGDLLPDAYEPDDDYLSARVFPVDALQTNRTIHTTNDIDFVSVSVDPLRYYAFETGNMDWGLESTLTLYDVDGTTPLATVGPNGANGASRLEYFFEQAGTYFLKVGANNRATAGKYTLTVRDTRIRRKWCLGNTDIYSSPAIAADGTVYVGASNGKVYGLALDGTTTRVWQMSAPIYGSPVIGPDGAVYVAASNRVYSLNPASGAMNWVYTNQFSGITRSSPALDTNGTLYVPMFDYRLHAIDAVTGTSKWMFASFGGNWMESAPAIGADGMVYWGRDNNKLYAINAVGQGLWTSSLPASIQGAPALESDGSVYAASYNGGLFQIGADGSTRRTWNVAGTIAYPSPVLGPDGAIYQATDNGKLYSFNYDGTTNWTLQLPGGFQQSSPAVGADGTIYMATGTNRYFVAIRPDGSINFTWDFGFGLYAGRSTPLIDTNGLVYIGTYGYGWVYALYGTSSPTGGLAASPWPMSQGNARRTGRSTFTYRPRLLTIVSSHGTATPSVGIHTNPFRAMLTNMVVSPDVQGLTQYVSLGWAMAGHDPADGPGTEFVMTATNDAVLTWQWSTNYYLTVTNDVHGTATPPSGWYSAGSSVVVSAFAETYYRFTNWTGDVSGPSAFVNPLLLGMDAPKSITAIFAACTTTNNGTPEWWLASYGLTNHFDEEAAADQDHDGLLTWEEFIAGTIPTNPSSLFVVSDSDLIPAGGSMVIQWNPSVNGRIYTVQRSTNLLSGFSDVTNLHYPSGVYTVTVDGAAAGSYRMRVRQE
ncbi:MAG: hypothetical protein A2X46_03440 [Lentisphaerae bacterium GWF2_57_35]|nr:MAG: hypothetical protein A2X46_03440 [Lentisphaerae bacterium GWF2_57_35]